MTTRTTNERVLAETTGFFLGSGDFNGIPLGTLADYAGIDMAELRSVLREAIQSGDAELAFERHSGNPHIKRIAALSVGEQLERLEQGNDLICVYPSAERVRAAGGLEGHSDRPYTSRLRLAEAQLTSVFFELSVLERYFQDPRYRFEFRDIGGSISVRDEHYQAGTLPEKDQGFLQTFGIGYDANRNRIVVVFLRYLHGLSPEHQHIWHAHEVAGPCTMNSDYERTAIWGTWPQFHSVYHAFIHEQVEINKLSELIGRPKLFRKTFEEARPEGFLPMLRPTRNNLHAFVQTLDKMLSENMDPEFVGSDVPLWEDVPTKDGHVERQRLGSLTVLERWLSKVFRVADGTDVSKEAVEPLKRIRKLRSTPAHVLGTNDYDMRYPKEQDQLLGGATRSLTKLRLILSSHPDAQYVAPEWLDSDKIVFY
jgi:hypothetical protein